MYSIQEERQFLNEFVRFFGRTSLPWKRFSLAYGEQLIPGCSFFFKVSQGFLKDDVKYLAVGFFDLTERSWMVHDLKE